MRLLTYNAGLLDLRILGRSLIKPADFIEERFARLASSLRTLDADLVTLQEVYTAAHKKALVAALKDLYPFAALSPLRGPSVVPASLLTLSRWPIEAQAFHRFRDMPIAERLVDNKGFLVTRVRTPAGELCIANVHTTAGGTQHPEHPATDAIRARQLAQLLAEMGSGTAAMMTGDFNCGSVSTGNYRQLQEAGFADIWPALRPADEGWTWDPESVLNAGGTHTGWGCPAQRIDLVLQNRAAARAWSAEACRLVFTAQDVPLADGRTVTLSDHYGVMAEFASTGASAAGER